VPPSLCPLLRAAVALILAAVFGAAAQAQPTYLRGIDVSHWQGTINWTSVKDAGYTFAFCKATEGLTFKDPRFAANWSGMKAVGLIRGAYHFGRPGKDPVAQADFFVNTVRPVSGDLQLVLDLEATDGKTPAQVWAWTQAFHGRVKSRTGRPGIIYTGYYFWRDSVGNPTNNLNCPLWLAYWGTGNPDDFVPQAWSKWSFWQYSSTGSVPGISGNVDLDNFSSSLETLKKLTLP
jgi:lysozyme